MKLNFLFLSFFQSTTGSLESLNLDRKRPSLASGDLGLSASSQDHLLNVEAGGQVPALVSTCFKHLESTGLHTLGIFRVSTSKKRVRQVCVCRLFRIDKSNA